MKTSILRFRGRALFLASSLFCLTLATSCDKDDDDDNNVDNRPYTISGTSNGTQVVPSVSGTGTGAITGTYDPANMTFNYTSTWDGLSGAPTTAGFYSGATGVSGTSVGTPWTIASDAAGTGTTTGTMTLTADQASQLTAGNWYYSYGTTMNPSGEIRGQITATR